jgi:hypothetical protein
LRYSQAQMSVPLSEFGKYQKYGWMSLGLWLLLTPLCTYLCFEAIVAGTGTYVPAIAPPVVAIRAGEGFWGVTAFLSAMVLAGCLVALLVRLMLGGEKSAEYRMLSNRKIGFNVTRGYVALGVLLVTLSLAMGFFGLHSGLFLGRDELAFTRMWSLHEEHYRYDQVKALREVPGDEGRSNFVIQVNGAPDWSTEREVSHPDDEQKAMLAQRTGKRIAKAVRD